MRVIRVDEDVYRWIQSLATPFEDNPNSVLRRVANLSPAGTNAESVARDVARLSQTGTNLQDTNGGRSMAGGQSRSIGLNGRLSGKKLKKVWRVECEHALYHSDGTFYENLNRFPGVLFDPYGYVMFRTEEEYRSCPYLSIGQKLNVPLGIASIPGYKKMRV